MGSSQLLNQEQQARSKLNLQHQLLGGVAVWVLMGEDVDAGDNMKKIFIVLGFIAILVLGFIFVKGNFTGNPIEESGDVITLMVAIPCSGHAYLIEDGLNKLQGVLSVNFRFPNYFNVKYDSTKISKQEILLLNIFKQYKATEVK